MFGAWEGEAGVAKKRAGAGASESRFHLPKPMALIGSGPTSRAIKRTVGRDPSNHLVQVGLDSGRTQVSACALSAEISGCEYLVFAPNFDDWGAALAAGRQRRAKLLEHADTVFEAARMAKIRHVVLITTAMVYGARADQPPLPDHAPKSAERDAGLVGDALAVEELAEAAINESGGDLGVTFLRPAALVGPDVDTAATRHFEAPRILVLRNIPIAWQFAHVDDVAGAVIHVLRQGLTGPVAVGAPGILTQTRIEQISGMRRVEVPESMARASADRLYQVGALPMPPTDLTYVTRSWAVEANRLTASGWEPLYDNAQCFRELLIQARKHHAVAGRRLGGKDAAALGAAGAAVALLGTAAVWRRARGIRRR